MHFIDLHCDTIWRMKENQAESTLSSEHLCVSLDKMKAAKTSVQFFACYLDLKMHNEMAEADEYLNSMIRLMKREVDLNRTHLAFAGNACQIQQNIRDEKISVLLTLEEGGIIDGDLTKLDALYEAGIRLITLTWNAENCIGFPNSKDAVMMKQGLKPCGFETVERMNELGMIIDVSHLSDGGFHDVIRYSKHPVVASHSNARALCNHPRNLSDTMLRALGEAGGVVGVNFYPLFLGNHTHVSAKEIVKHIRHIANVAGLESVAIGTDFDGFDMEGYTMEISHIGEMWKLYEELSKAGFQPSQCEKICFGNAMRVIREIL